MERLIEATTELPTAIVVIGIIVLMTAIYYRVKKEEF